MGKIYNRELNELEIEELEKKLEKAKINKIENGKDTKGISTDKAVMEVDLAGVPDEITFRKRLLRGMDIDEKWYSKIKPNIVFFVWGDGQIQIIDNIKTGIIDIEDKNGKKGSYLISPKYRLYLGKQKIPVYLIMESDFVPMGIDRDPIIPSKLVRDWVMSIKANEQNRGLGTGIDAKKWSKWIIIGGIAVIVIAIVYMYFTRDTTPAQQTIKNGVAIMPQVFIPW